MQGNDQGILDFVPMGPGRIHPRTGWSSMAAWLEALESTEVKNNSWTQSPRVGNERWSGGSWAGAVRLCREGWPEGARRAALLRDKIEARHPIRTQLSTWSVAGAVPSVPRAVGGNPMNMRKPDPSRTNRRPVVTLCAQTNGTAQYDAEEFENRAAIVAAIVDVVEAAGYSTHVIGFAYSSGPGDSGCTMAITLKEPGEPADIGRLAFGLGHPALFRRFGFAQYAAHRELKSCGWGEGMGSTKPLSVSKVSDSYVIPGLQDPRMQGAFRSEKGAVEKGLPLMIRALKEQGCPAFPKEEF